MRIWKLYKTEKKRTTHGTETQYRTPTDYKTWSHYAQSAGVSDDYKDKMPSRPITARDVDLQEDPSRQENLDNSTDSYTFGNEAPSQPNHIDS